MNFPLLLTTYSINEQTIWLYQPNKETIAASYRKGAIAFPYWSQVWPAAIGLSQFLMQNPQYIKGKKILELAAGLGLPSIIAAATAEWVIISDYATEAVEAMQQTMDYNGLQNVQVQLLDWNDLPPHLSADVLLLSDVSYDAALFATQEKIIRQFLEKGTTVIISTPQRLIAKEAIAPLLAHCTQQEEMIVQHHEKEVAITVMVLVEQADL